MMHIARTDKSIVGRWWWTVDRWTLLSFIVLMAFGIVLVTAASPSVAARIGLSDFHFVYKHLIFLVISFASMIVVSLLDHKTLWRVSSLLLVGCLLLMVFVVLFGGEVKGAKRWIYLFGFSLQPSEFIKPAFAIVSAWFLAKKSEENPLQGLKISTGLFAVILVLLAMQPDFGMSFVMAFIWGAQMFLVGLPFQIIVSLAVFGVVMIGIAYLCFPHVASRIDRFWDPSSGDNYQVKKSLQAFDNGGLFGTGPGEGQVKLNLPDAHSDFIFAVAGEELGLLAALFLVGVFCFIIVRGMMRISKSSNMFVILAVGGLLTQIAVQTLVHMGSSLQLLPAKGMTLPFISYGGSSLLALGVGCGMLLSLTRRGNNMYVDSRDITPPYKQEPLIERG